VQLMESYAARVLSKHEHLAWMKIEIEHRKRGGRRNGELIVTTDDFVAYGIERRQIPAALRALEALGIIIITDRGHGGHGPNHLPHFFLLNYDCGMVEDEYGNSDNGRDAITNSWARFANLEEAEGVAQKARKAKDPKKVGMSRTASRYRTCTTGQVQKMHAEADFPGTEPVPTIDSKIKKKEEIGASCDALDSLSVDSLKEKEGANSQSLRAFAPAGAHSPDQKERGLSEVDPIYNPEFLAWIDLQLGEFQEAA
jgi:hypothetical protein